MSILKNLFGKTENNSESKKTVWNPLTSIHQLADVEKDSFEKETIIFKHSTRCNISVSVLHKFEKNIDPNIKLYYLDLLNYREVSNEIATKYYVTHQSPQILVFKDGKVIHHASHYDILEKY